MRGISTFFIAFVALLIIGASAQAQLLVEPFNYPDHATSGLAAQSTGNWFNVNSGDSVLVEAGSLNYSGLQASTANKIKFDGAGIDPQRTFSSQTTGTVYYSFLLRCTSLTGITSSTGSYFTGFRGGSTTTFGQTIWIKNNDGNSFFLGVSPRSSGGTPVQTYATPSFPINTTVLVVASYEFIGGTTNDVVKLWIDPSSSSFGGSEPTPDLTITNNATGGDLTSIDGVFLRQDALTSTPFLEMDEIRVGTSWAVVTPPGINQYRSFTSGDWNSTATWEVSTNGGGSWNPAASTPTSADGSITIQSPHVVTVTASVTVDQVTVATGGTLHINNGNTLTVNDGAGDDVTVNGSMSTAGSINGTGTIAVNGGSFRIDEGGWGGNTNTYTYNSTGTLVFNNSAGFYGVNSDAVWWPTTISNVTVQNTGGVQLNVSRTVTGLFQTSTGVKNSFGNDLFANGSVQMNAGGYFDNFSPTYGSSSTLIYNTSYGPYNEWIGNATSAGYGVPKHVTIQNGAVVSMPSTDRGLAGNMNINDGTLALNGTSGSLYIAGNWNRGASGIFTPATRPVIFNGSSAQSLTASGGGTFDGLTVDNASGLTLMDNVAVNGALTLTNGIVTTGANTLTVGGSASVARTNGYVNGNLKRTYTTTGSKSFPVGTANGYSPVTVDATAGTGDFTVIAVQGGHVPAYSANQLLRYWTLTSSGITQADLTFNYLEADVVGNENNYAIRKYDGAWTSPGGSVNTTTNEATIAGVTSFSSWTLAESAPSIILTGTLANFGVLPVGGTSSEQSYSVEGTNLTANILITAPTDFEISDTSGSGFGPTVTLVHSGGTVAPTTIYVRFAPGSTGNKSGNITHASTGATQQDQAVSGKAIGTSPTIQASAVNFTGVGLTSMTVNWTNGNGSDRIVLMKFNAAVNSDPVDTASYTANPVFASGSQIGTGNYVVYAGPGSSVAVNGLTPGATYHVAVYEYNGSGGFENYLAPGATGSQPTATASYTWTGAVDNVWGTAGNWNPSRTTPATTDGLLFDIGGSVTVTGVPAQTIGQLLVTNSTNLTLQAPAAATLAISGGPGIDLSVGAGSGLNLAGTKAISLSLAAGTTGNVAGSMIVADTTHRVLVTDASGLVFASGASFKAEVGFLGNAFGTTSLNSVVFQSGSVYIQNAGSNPFGAGSPNSVVVFQTGSLYKFTAAAGAPAYSGRTYADVEFDSPQTVSSTGGSTLTFDNYTVTSGTQNLNLTGTINAKGNITVASGATLAFNPAGSPTLNLNGTSAQSISGTGTLTFSAGVAVNMNNAAGLTLNRNVTLAGSLTLTDGIITTGLNTLTVGGNVSRTSGHVNGKLQLTMPVSAGAGSKTWNIGDATAYTPVFVGGTSYTSPFPLTVSTTTGDHPDIAGSGLNAAKSVNRYYTILGTPTGPSDVTFNFVPGDLDGGVDTAAFGIAKYDSPSWTATTVGTRTATSTQALGVTSFSDFAIGEAAAPTTINVTFQVDMRPAMQAGLFRPDLSDVVEVRGGFNGWSGEALADGNADSIYTITKVLGIGSSHNYKYAKTLRGGVEWEEFGGDRSVTLGSADTTLGVVYFSNFSESRLMTLQVNMKVKILQSQFDPNTDIVTVRGAFNNWGDSGNDDILSDGDVDSVYTIIKGVTGPRTLQYKYWSSSGLGYESISNREFSWPAADSTIAVVYFNNDPGPPAFSVNPASLNFGAIPIGSLAVDSLTVTNTGGGPLNVSAAGPDPQFAVVPNGPVAIASGDSAKFYVTFSPSTPGVKNGIIEFTHDAPGNPDTVHVTGEGLPLDPVFSANPTSLSFGTVVVGDFAVDSVEISNPGLGDLEITSASGPDPQFAVVPNAATITPGNSFTFFVTFAPASPGPKSGNIIFVHNAASSPDSVAVDGFGADSTNILLLTVTPDSIISKDPVKGKLLKPVKRGKGLHPNWANLMDETVAQGGFAPGTSESDQAGGMVVGVSHMFEAAPTKWKPVKDSAAVRGWVRLTKWNFAKNLGKSFNVLQKTLEDKTGKHDGAPRGLDMTTDGKNKPILKQLTKLVPKKHDNALFAELVALKLNIAMSQLGKTPAGFGDLIYDDDASVYDEMSIVDISAAADVMMTYWQGLTGTDYSDLYDVVRAINSAFAGSLDTISFNTGNKLQVHGKVALGSIPFLKAPSPFVPTRISPTTNETESGEDLDFDDEEFEESLTPVAAKLYQNYPNPFNPSTTISFRLRETSQVTIRIFNTLGQHVATLMEGEELEEGLNTVQFAAGQLSSGVYFYQIHALGLDDETLQTVASKKMVLLK